MSPTDNVMDKLVSLAKRRGFVFQSSEIYGGLGSLWDYGPLGVELKKNIKERWWRSMVHDREDIEGLDAAILMHPKVWKPRVTCRGLPIRWWIASTARTGRSSRQKSNHSRSVPGFTKNCISICSNSRVRKMKLPGVISFRNAFPICAIPNGIFWRDDCSTLR